MSTPRLFQATGEAPQQPSDRAPKVNIVLALTQNYVVTLLNRALLVVGELL